MMGERKIPTDFQWTDTNEPHAIRRKLILEKYPEIKSLFGHDHKLKWIMLSIVVFQLLMAYLASHLSWPLVLCLAYCVGGVVTHSILTGIHEIAHCQAFGYGRTTANKMIGIVANLPLGLPFSVAYKTNHMLHHRYLANEALDTTFPLEWEARFFTSTLGKIVWLSLLPFIMYYRELKLRTFPVTKMEVVNFVVQMIFDAALFHAFGPKGLIYMFGGAYLGQSFHPLAAYYLSPHYTLVKGYETFSYYGCMNRFTFNVGYHNEHHDFPAVPASKLPLVKKMAPEFYDTLPCHTSLTKLLVNFITNPEFGHYSCVKRKNTVKLDNNNKE